MSDGMTEVQAYRHLLDVAENIIESMDPDREIMSKYEALKKAVKGKITNQKQSESFQSICHNIYRSMLEELVNCLTNFEAEMQNKIQASFEQSVLKFKKQYNMDIDRLHQLSIPKRKQLVKQETAKIQQIYKETCTKLQNLSLLLQIHGKMHEIIEQAAGRQLNRHDKDVKMQRKIQQLEQQIVQVQDAQQFIRRYQLANASRQQFKTLQKQLRNLLE